MAEKPLPARIEVDTDVFSYLFRGDAVSLQFRPYLVGRTPALSFMTVGELYFGAYRRAWGARKLRSLEEAVRRYTVLPFTFSLCQRWAQIRAEREKAGRPISVSDAWVAASALEYGCALLTNNRKDFEGIPGLIVVTTLPTTGA